VSITAEDVRHIAKLAELDLVEAELPKLTAQLDAILDYVSQLTALGDAPSAGDAGIGPAAAPLRADVVRPISLARPLEELAPEFRDGFFLVPRLAAMDEP
jgi:aspartyl-tRNA(Asn)/glutamyl-tRNA(Gln) amidotransferase subunit C